MRKLLTVLLFLIAVFSCSKPGNTAQRSNSDRQDTVQNNYAVDVNSNVKKYALVIGNGNYTEISKLKNPVNDASDISGVLQKLGFTVDTVLNGGLEEM